jgi:predicted nucleic acid-binding protein
VNVIADTGYVVAIANETDQYHLSCVTVHTQQRVVYLPQSALTEIMYFLKRDLGNERAAQFLMNLKTSKYRLLALEPQDVDRAGYLMRQYADSKLDFVDASVIALAERLHITRILTLDKRDFGMVRPQHVEIFELLP